MRCNKPTYRSIALTVSDVKKKNKEIKIETAPMIEQTRAGRKVDINKRIVR